MLPKNFGNLMRYGNFDYGVEGKEVERKIP